MANDTVRLIIKYFPVILPFAFSQVYHAILASIHKFTYKSLSPDLTKNVIIIGGSFSGTHLARRLSDTLPSGYKVILIERNSHFNHTFNFPRYSVLEGREEKVFIPYDGIVKRAPKGIIEVVRGEVKRIGEGYVKLVDDREIRFEFLAVATGVTQSPPAKLISCEKAEGCAELRVLQKRIREAKKIAVVGAGAVGVQISADIKSFFPEKEVLLIHSREQLLSNFGKRLHEFVVEKLGFLGVEIRLGERPALPKTTTWEPAEIEFKDGSKEMFDLVIPCTGQTPNSSIIGEFLPSSVSKQTHRILVKPTLQLQSESKFDGETIDHIFAVGDVAETGSAKMARAGILQAEIVQQNILSLIEGNKLRDYKPSSIESALKLSLGKDENVAYVKHEDGTDYLMSGKEKNLDLAIKQSWWYMNADLKNAATV